jgi:hypothetical protein
MAAIADLSDYVNRATGGNSGTPENVFWYKQPYIAATIDTWAAGLMYSMWKYDGFPGPGATPTTVAAPTSSTAGAMPFTDPGGGRQKWLMTSSMITVGPNAGGVFLYDRLLHIGSLDGTVTTAQTVGGSLTRHTGGAGNQIWIEIYTAVGTTNRTITASYTNQSGTSGRTTQAVLFGASAGKPRQRRQPDDPTSAASWRHRRASCGLGDDLGDDRHGRELRGHCGVADRLHPVRRQRWGDAQLRHRNARSPGDRVGGVHRFGVYAMTTTEAAVYGALGMVEA